MLRINTPPLTNRKPAPESKPRTGVDDVNRLLDAGRLDEAYPLLKDLAVRQPKSLSVLTTAALTAVKLEKLDDARTWFERALTTAHDDYDTIYNLAVLDTMEERWSDALIRLRRLRAIRPDDSSLLNDIAVVWSNCQRPRRALATFRRALRIDPNDSNTRNNAMQFCIETEMPQQALKLLRHQEATGELTERSKAEVHRWREIIEQALGEQPKDETPPQPAPEVTTRYRIEGRKLVFFAAQQTFVKDIIEELSRSNTVKLFAGGTIDEMRELMAWADLAWFEWCDNFIIEATKLPKTCHIVCRLHSYEAFTDMPSKVNWDRVDHLIFVNQSVQDIFRQQITNDISTSIVHNGVNLQRFTIPTNKSHTKRIASVGYINYKKNPALLLYCFKKIYEYDPEYSLHIAGSHQDVRIQLYFQHFLNRNPLPVYFDGWVDDIPSWFEDKGYVISTSLFESFHYSIAEGMASGVLPLIHDWFGADKLYPKDYLFGDPDGCVCLLKQLEQGDVSTLRTRNRQHIEQRFNAREKTNDLAAILYQTLQSSPAAATEVASGRGM
ncbi:glycosyltransferase [candidate division GN15 bacterium]|nr:glycosyltransferase [candidate division GN15 bacterium]